MSTNASIRVVAPTKFEPESSDDSRKSTVKLARSFTTFLSTGGVYAASQWATLVVVARMGGPENLGEYTVALAVCAPIIVFSRLNMQTVQATDSRDEYEFGDYALARVILTLGGLALIAGYSIFSGHPYGAAFVLIGVALFKSIESLGDIVQGLLRKHERIRAMATATHLRSTTLLLGITIGLYALDSFPAGIMLVVLAWWLVFVSYEREQVRKLTVSWRSSSWRRSVDLARKCFPSGLGMLLGSLTVNVPVYVIEHFRGVAQAGYYSAAAFFMPLGGLIAAAIAQSVMARLSVEYNSSRERYRTTLGKILLVSCALGGSAIVLASLIGRDILALLYGADYAAHEAVLLWITVAAALSFPAALFGLGVTIARRFTAGLMVNLVSLAVVSILATILVPSHGLVGGAWALAGATGVRVLLSGAVVAFGLKTR
jgi:O-antigen/teichoic acid export membrane protein